MADDNDDNEGNADWRRIKGLQVDSETGGEKAAKGVVDLATGTEENPCFMCKSWEKAERKLAQHFRAHGLTIQPDGTIQTPLIRGSKSSMKLKIQEMGWCRRDSMPTHDTATCPAFNQVKRREEMRARMALVNRVRG